MNSLTMNLHLMMASFYRPVGMRDKVLIEEGAFSSDRHAILGQLSWHKLDAERDAGRARAARRAKKLLRIEDIEAKIEELGSELALVLWPGVQYRTGQAFDCARIARAAHAPARWLDSISRMPSATCRWRCTTGTSISRCGALTSI